MPHPPHQIDVVRAALPAGYEIIDYLDQGGQGSVFDGRYNGQRAAIKVFNPLAEQERIDREVAALCAIDCDYLVKVRAHSSSWSFCRTSSFVSNCLRSGVPVQPMAMIPCS